MDPAPLSTLLPFAFFVVAVLYSSVGHAGATGYLAVMALSGVVPDVMRPTALVLNLAVASVAVARFAAARQLPWQTLLYFVVGSAPTAFLAGRVEIPDSIYRPLLSAVLAAAAIRLASRASRDPSGEPTTRPPRRSLSALIGGGIGLLAGATGTGGGVFLTPLVIARRWAGTRAAAGLSAGFILVNSVAGLVARPASLDLLPATMPLLLGAAAVGGVIGSELGARRASLALLRRLLAAVMAIASIRLLIG
ncbi:MAG: TSUP family transporter [Candidatus Limnocylindrus sp.]